MSVCLSVRSVEIYCSYLRCLLVTYVADKSLASSHVKVTGEGQGHFSEGSRLLGKVMSCCVADK